MTTPRKTPITDAAEFRLPDPSNGGWERRVVDSDRMRSLEEAAQGLRDAFSEDNLRRYHNACADAFSENLRASRRGTDLVHEMEKQFSEALARFDALKEAK